MRIRGTGGPRGRPPAHRPQPDAARELPLDDPQALGRLLRELEPRLSALALRLVRDRCVAEDVVQSAFEKAIRNGRGFRGDARVSTWLHRIVANEALMWLRSRGRRQEATALDGEDAPHLAEPGPDPLEQVARRQGVRRLHAALRRLPRPEREVLLRCVLPGRSYRDYARECGVHPAALKSRAFRARRRLEALLAAPGS